MQTREYDLLFRIAVYSNIILIAAVLLNHACQFTSRVYFALLLLLYVPCEFGSLTVLLKKLSQIQKERSIQKGLQLKAQFQTEIEQEIKKEQERLASVHACLEAQLEDFAAKPGHIEYTPATPATYCSPLLLNALFVHKDQQAARAGIPLHLDIRLSSQCAEIEESLLSLFANLLDNALQAAKESPDPSVQFSAASYKNLIKIRVENSITPGFHVRLHSTSKRVRYRHGFGIQIICSILQEQNGRLFYDQNRSKFVQEIYLELHPGLSPSGRRKNCIQKRKLI